MSLFIPTYFAPISQYAAIYKSKNIVFEINDNFQKQTYRNRCYIYGANGKLSLNVPIKHNSNGDRKKTKDTQVGKNFPWQKQHLKSLQAAYRSSPFFEFFEDDLQKIFDKNYKYLHDLLFDSHLFIMDSLGLDSTFTKTSEYVLTSKDDFRTLAVAKKGTPIQMDTYVQMFDEKHGFIPNLSILDLLFMEGRNSLSFLDKISLNL